MLKGDCLLYNENDKANEFNMFFSAQSNIDETNANLPNGQVHIQNTLSEISLRETEIEDVLSILNPSKASGPDLISPRLLKEAAKILSKPLCKLFNKSLQKSVFPSQWKKAHVTPVFKNGKPNDVKNYRPISLLCIISKCMERCVYKHVYNHLRQHNALSEHQSGFTRGDSAVNQLINISNDFGKALDAGKEIRVVFCDISKAFDRVWHKGLLYKLQKSGISGSLLEWFRNYLSGRAQRVVLNGSYSDWLFITAGVPQGSILGPLLFLIFINDIVDEIQATIKLFADDTSLYIVVDNPVDAAEILNSDISKIYKWSQDWLVKFNPQKTETMIVSRKINKPIHPSLEMNGHEIESVENHKHLGVYFSCDGKWIDHCNYIIDKSYKRINILRKLKSILDRFSLEKLYLSFIRPILEYADVIWDFQNQSYIDKIENVQLDAARIVTGGTKLTSIQKLYDETRWEKLTDRRKRHKLLYFHKMVNNSAPQYLVNLVPNRVGSRHEHNTRQTDNLLNINTRTSLYASYFLPSSIKLWNSLQPEIRLCNSISLFKRKLQDQNNKVPVHYYSGCRLGQILHTRLRMNSSSLNSHIFLRNLTDSPNCRCGSIETNSHFLLFCPLYRNLRRDLIDSVTQLSTGITVNEQLLLYGSNELTDKQNCDLFLLVQNFIIKTKRFTS